MSAEFLSNGFKAQVAMFMEAPAEQRDGLDQMLMSLPLGAALAITSLRSTGDSLHVELVPQLFEPEDEPNRAEMLEQTCNVIKDAWYYVMGGKPEEVFFQTTSVVVPDEELQAKLQLPSRRILNADGSKA